LKAAGFKQTNGTMTTPQGKPFTLSIINVGGFTDWVAEVDQIRLGLKQLGITLTPENLEGNTVTAREQSGNFQLAYGGPTAGPTPYYWYRALLHSANSAPIGQTASSNFDRWRNPTTDRILDQFATTASGTQQYKLMSRIQGIMLADVPYIPVLEGVSWYQYDTTKFTGWPTPQNAYVNPAPYQVPDWEIVLTTVHLK
jgi:peptide/nickel transport system substrate-binding protein